MRPFSKYSGPLLIALCAVFLIAQVLVRPAVGLSDNGDFPKMAGPFGLGPEDGNWFSHDQFGEFVYRYIRADRYNYLREFGKTEFLSSQYFFVKFARGAQRILHPGPRFDIRWLGSVTGIFFLTAIGIWIYALPQRLRFWAGLPVVFIWTDVAYVQYLNSFYMDTAAMISLVLFVAAALHFIKNPENRAFALIIVLAGALFALSKPQHALAALLLAILLWAFAWRSRDRIARSVLIGGSILLIGGPFFIASRVTRYWTAHNVFDVVFLNIAPSSPDPLHALEELGLGAAELRLVGTYAYQGDSPMENPGWAEKFYARCNYSNLVRYYLRHPLTTVRLVYARMQQYGPDIRPWGNLSREDGFNGRAQSSSFAYWSNIRSYLFRLAPWYVFALEFAVILGTLRLMFGKPEDRVFAFLLFTMQLVALSECAGSVLAAAAETQRHLFLFHLATDATILLVPPLILKLWKATPK